HTPFSRDWSSDVCSSDLVQPDPSPAPTQPTAAPGSARLIPSPKPTNGGAESYEALKGFGPSLLSALDAMRRRREHRVLTAGTKRSEARRVGKGGKRRWAA